MAKDLIISTWNQVDEIPRHGPRDSFRRESRQKLLNGLFAWLFLFAGPLQFSELSVAGEVLVNGSAGRVDRVVFTIDDVRFFLNIARLKDGQSDLQEVSDRDLLFQMTQKMLFEEMVLSEMRTLKIEGGNRSVAQLRLQEIRKRVGGEILKRLLARYRKAEAAVLNQLQRAIDVEKFLEKKVETLTPVLTEAEAERYFKENLSKFGGATLESIKPAVMRMAQKSQMEKGLQDWITLLKEKHGVVNLIEK